MMRESKKLSENCGVEPAISTNEEEVCRANHELICRCSEALNPCEMSHVDKNDLKIAKDLRDAALIST